MDWVAAAFTLTAIYLTGDRRALGPVVSLAGQVPWAYVTVSTQQWGLLLVSAAITFLNIRTIRLWRKDGLPWW